MASGEGGGNIADHGDVYYCFLCQNTIVAVEPDMICPDCSSGFISLLTPGRTESDHGLFEGDRIPSETDSSPIDSGLDLGDFYAETVTDLIGQMHVYDGLNDEDSVPSRPDIIPAGYTPDDAVMDPFQWDRILSWFFENGGAFLNAGASLSDEQIESIPVSLLKAKDIEKTATCPICIDDFKLKEEVKILPCKHFFHKECIVSWLRVRANCPVCRENVEIEEHTRNIGMVLRVPDTDESLREATVASSDERCLEDERRRHSVSGIYCDFSERSDTSESASGSSGTSYQNHRPSNQAICDRRRHSHDARGSQYHPDANRSEPAPPHTGHGQASERAPRRRALFNPARRNYYSHHPLDGRSSLSSYIFPGRSVVHINRPYDADISPDAARRIASYADQPRENVSSDSTNLLHCQRNSGDNSIRDSGSRHQSSTSSSLEDLSSVVPILPPNMVL